ncbi:hypothetical protein [Microbacterium album]|uniref:Uncharacterized protein n=1 Tax=Microbacterium album TaxID=2053191 RepID=A0A917IEP4_9MICO|nr:hypothetical protein [Microbacterium album]GGH38989.1 hypothetical protein GCM10010921_09960 [Microbacterium album]
MAAEFGGERFVDAIYAAVFAPAVDQVMATLQEPPGRERHPRLVELHRWFASRGAHDRLMLRAALRECADSAVFGLLAVLDGARPISDGFQHEPRLLITDGDHETQIAPEGDDGDLHGIFRSLVDERTAPTIVPLNTPDAHAP